MQPNPQRQLTDEEKTRQASSNIRLLVILVLFAAAIVGSLFITSQLRKSAAMQDCMASGRTNCAPVNTTNQ
jgi:flagellar basal body-associated protein FliL